MNTKRVLATLGVLVVLLATGGAEGNTGVRRAIPRGRRRTRGPNVRSRWAGLPPSSCAAPGSCSSRRPRSTAWCWRGIPEIIEAAKVSTGRRPSRHPPRGIFGAGSEPADCHRCADAHRAHRCRSRRRPHRRTRCGSTRGGHPRRFNLVFEDSTIGDLMLNTEGAANIDLDASSVTNARARPGGGQPAQDQPERRLAHRARTRCRQHPLHRRCRQCGSRHGGSGQDLPQVAEHHACCRRSAASAEITSISGLTSSRSTLWIACRMPATAKGQVPQAPA